MAELSEAELSDKVLSEDLLLVLYCTELRLLEVLELDSDDGLLRLELELWLLGVLELSLLHELFTLLSEALDSLRLLSDIVLKDDSLREDAELSIRELRLLLELVTRLLELEL